VALGLRRHRNGLIDGAHDHGERRRARRRRPARQRRDGRSLAAGRRGRGSRPPPAFSLTLSRPADAQAGAPAAFVTVFARGLGKHQFTVIFLADDASLDTAAILCQVPAERRHTLLARPQGTGSYAWDIALQGADETVFFDYV
jgi:protocatechuate 3,4-dioxygenase alpha subunit